MKTRQGFVSNSSSSSFVIVTTIEKWKAAQKSLITKVGKDVADVIIHDYGQGTKAKVLGQDALVFTGVISSEEYGYDATQKFVDAGTHTEDEAADLAMKAYEKMGELDKILKADGLSFVDSTGC